MVRFLPPFLVALCLFGIIPDKLHTQPAFAIHEVQGTENESPLQGQLVTLQGNIVTARGDNFFVIQAPESDYDNNAFTSEAVVIAGSYFGSPGDVVEVTGTVREEDGLTIIASPGLSITNTGEDLPLPSPVVLTETLPSANYTPVHSLERLEGMRVSFEAIANGPSSSFEDVPLRIGPNRIFREPGIEAPGIVGLPEWDGNPEIFWMDPNGLNAPNQRFFNTGSLVSATGIMIEAAPRFWKVLAETYTFTPGPDAAPVRPKAANEFTVGSLNALFLLEEEENIEVKYQKIARYIDEQMGLPDILAMQEVGSFTELNNLAFYLEQQNPQAQYDAYLLPTNLDLKLGYLVKEHFTNLQISQLGTEETFTFSGGLLHDRPPLLLQVELPTGPPVTLQVLNLHLRSLIGIEGSTAGFVRNKRHQQAISIANMIQDLQTAGNLVVLGDFNAFQFTDGYVDVFNQIAGLPGLGAQFPLLNIVDPPLSDQLQSIPPPERYSYVFDGNAQALDHCLTSSFNGLTVNGMQYARGNADFPEAYELSLANPLSASDHDGLVLFLESEFPIASQTATRQTDIRILTANPAHPGALFLIKSGTILEDISLFNLTGQLIANWQPEDNQYQGTWSDLPFGLYLLKVQSQRGIKTFQQVITE
ncbi:MAG: T9SS type A sorting domain-containing protein [Phaeodactylibacter xiamenensis]|uniref:Endonuclease/exonuclease/phosphatase domain-containing protein n=1 Tax=Phaeodactylibacter xiamenensis TaxID=1524460 RepID=A0A098S0E8_9BACT|nr:T9SS type A sorting domain-containing protein [Phaeodactylibacter xiamenensis]KGE85620.1 hypothetical protein IX84_26380 [Phaeodactylibacter xiamenensis]MCR9052368.1 T9SS type A sorting domain-containing protein [bacterium]